MINISKSQKIISNLRLLEQSGKLGFSLNQLRVIVALERLVARLESNSVLSNHLIFKGGFALLKHLDSARFTHDLDASYFLFPLEKLIPIIEGSITTNIEDGLWYGDIKHESILIENDYNGVRFNCAFQIGEPLEGESRIKKLSRIHFDIGLSDEKSPQLKKMEMPSLLSNAQPISWYVYPLEQIFAEKLETFIKRGGNNSRAKDIYDMVTIYPKCQNMDNLTKTIRQVFEDRNTELPKSLRSFAEKIDLTILQTSWTSVMMPEPRLIFEDIWQKMLGIFSIIEKQL